MSTIEDVARLAGVSISTVSRALTRPDMVAAATRDRVLAATHELDYLHNPSARALATGRSGLLGLMVPTLTNPFFAPIIAGAQTAAERAGNELVIVVSNAKPARERELLKRLQGRVDGLVAVSPRGQARDFVEALDTQPTVTINRKIRGVSSVVIDTPAGMERLGRHLTDLGHRRIAYLGGPEGSWTDRKRRRALASTLDAVGGELVTLPPLEPTFAAGSATAPQLTQGRCTAVVAYNSVLMLGVVHQLRQMGVPTPGRLSLACADDLTAVGLALPDFTALHVPAEEAGRTAVEVLIEQRTRAAQDPQFGFVERHHTLPVDLVEGASTTSPPG